MGREVVGGAGGRGGRWWAGGAIAEATHAYSDPSRLYPAPPLALARPHPPLAALHLPSCAHRQPLPGEEALLPLLHRAVHHASHAVHTAAGRREGGREGGRGVGVGVSMRAAARPPTRLPARLPCHLHATTQSSGACAEHAASHTPKPGQLIVEAQRAKLVLAAQDKGAVVLQQGGRTPRRAGAWAGMRGRQPHTPVAAAASAEAAAAASPPPAHSPTPTDTPQPIPPPPPFTHPPTW